MVGGQGGVALEAVDPSQRLDQGLLYAVLGQGRVEDVMELVVGPGDTVSMDTLELAVDAGVDPMECINFFFVFTWLVLEPEPPDDVGLQFFNLTQRGERVLLGEGPSGERSLGCGSLEIVNGSVAEVTLELRYVLAIFRM